MMLDELKQPKKNGKLEEVRIPSYSFTEEQPIVITPADKGGDNIFMNKEDYIHKGLGQLYNKE